MFNLIYWDKRERECVMQCNGEYVQGCETRAETTEYVDTVFSHLKC